MPNLGLQELLVIAAIMILLFGSNKVGKLMGGIGEGIRNFKDALRSDKEH